MASGKYKHAKGEEQCWRVFMSLDIPGHSTSDESFCKVITINSSHAEIKQFVQVWARSHYDDLFRGISVSLIRRTRVILQIHDDEGPNLFESWVSSKADLLEHISHRFTCLDLGPIGKEELDLHL